MLGARKHLNNMETTYRAFTVVDLTVQSRLTHQFWYNNLLMYKMIG